MWKYKEIQWKLLQHIENIWKRTEYIENILKFFELYKNIGNIENIETSRPIWECIYIY